MYSEHETKITIGAPIEGEWKFLRPPGHHPFAFDFVKVDYGKGKTNGKSLVHFILSRIPSEDYCCWKEQVYSPINGEIFRIGNGWHDHEFTNLWKTIRIWYNATYKFRPKKESGILDVRPNAGNYIMIKSDDGYIIFLGHLKNNSITVRQGQRVEQGEKLGLVGNSGNSTALHLHINLFDQMQDPFTAKVLPFVFVAFQVSTPQTKWASCTDSVPQVGALIKFNRITINSSGRQKAAPLS